MRSALCAVALAIGLIGAPAALAQSYPPVPSSITLNRSVAAVGQTVIVSGKGAADGATVIITFASKPVVVARTTASDSGRFRAAFRVPAHAAPGLHTVAAISRGRVLGTATLRILAHGSRLPFTGANAARDMAVGVSSVLAGLTLLLAVRRRRAGRPG